MITAVDKMLLLAMQGDIRDMLKWINKGANINARDATSGGQTVLHLAAISGNYNKMEKLIELSNDINIKDAEEIGGCTPLYRAAEHNNIEVVQLLLKNKADPNIPATKTGFTPLHICARKNRVSIAQLLLDYGADGSLRDRYGFNASYWAIERGHDAFVEVCALPKPISYSVAEIHRATQGATTWTIKTKKSTAKSKKGKGSKQSKTTKKSK